MKYIYIVEWCMYNMNYWRNNYSWFNAFDIVDVWRQDECKSNQHRVYVKLATVNQYQPIDEQYYSDDFFEDERTFTENNYRTKLKNDHH